MTSVLLQKVERTCIAAPIQWDAWGPDGTYFYLRHRHGRGRIENADLCVHFEGELDLAEETTLTSFLHLASLAGSEYTFLLAADAEIIPYREPEENSVSAVQAVESPPVPVPMLEGTFAIFEPGDGSLMLVWRKAVHPTAREQIRELGLQLLGESKGMDTDAAVELLRVAGLLADIADREPEEPTQYMPIPAMVMSMASQLSGGSLDPLQMMKMLKGVAQ
jgi:hypothetical protein